MALNQGNPPWNFERLRTLCKAGNEYTMLLVHFSVFDSEDQKYLQPYFQFHRNIIQGAIRQNTPTTIKTTVGEAAEVLDSLLNTHECLLKSRVEIQKRLESHPASRKMEIFRRHRSLSLGDTPKMQSKGEKKEAPSPPEERIAQKGKDCMSPSYAEATRIRLEESFSDDCRANPHRG